MSSVKENVDINFQDDYGNTPLHKAAFGGHIEAVRTLLQKGADPSVRNKSGDTPLSHVYNFLVDGYPEIIMLLKFYATKEVVVQVTDERVLLINLCRKVGSHVSIEDKIIFAYSFPSIFNNEILEKAGYSRQVSGKEIRYLKFGNTISEEEFYKAFPIIDDIWDHYENN